MTHVWIDSTARLVGGVVLSGLMYGDVVSTCLAACVFSGDVLVWFVVFMDLWGGSCSVLRVAPPRPQKNLSRCACF